MAICILISHHTIYHIASTYYELMTYFSDGPFAHNKISIVYNSSLNNMYKKNAQYAYLGRDNCKHCVVRKHGILWRSICIIAGQLVN